MNQDSWWTQIDAYCERIDLGFWSEPVNALSNAAFLLAAIAAVIAARRAGRFDAGMALLIALTTAIGIGSFLFHTFATRWAAVTDTVPILLFIIAYLVLAMRRFFGLGWRGGIAVGALFAIASRPVAWAAREAFGDRLGSSVGYLPALAALIIVAALLRRRRHPAARAMAGAVLLFVLSLGFRTADQPLCAAWPLGTHFLWHLLNGVLLGWLMLTMIRYGRPPHDKGRLQHGDARSGTDGAPGHLDQMLMMAEEDHLRLTG